MSQRVAIAGATGAVGQEFLRILAERDYPLQNLRLMASPRSAGREITWRGETLVVEDLSKASFADVDVAFAVRGQRPEDGQVAGRHDRARYVYCRLCRFFVALRDPGNHLGPDLVGTFTGFSHP